MGLLDKVRVLVGALVHAPFAPRREKAELTGPAPAPAGRRATERGAADNAIEETDRVADLIAQQKGQGQASN